MKIEDDILIENYLRGILTGKDLEDFLIRLDTDSALKEQFELEKQLFNSLNEDRWSFANPNSAELESYVEVLNDKSVQDLKGTLAETNSNYNNSNKQKAKPRTLYYYLAAASIVVFLGIQFLFNNNRSGQELYDSYIEFNNLPSFVTRNDNESPLNEAQKLFENKAYERALPILKEHIETPDLKGNVLLYLGISQVETEDFVGAEKTFNDLIQSGLLDAEKGYWYKALMFLKQNRLDDAKAILEKIVADNLFNSNKAEDILDELN